MPSPTEAARYDVVLVDDAPEVRAVLAAHLRLSGRFRVVGEGGSGAEALSLARAHSPALLVLDASMPGRDGLEVIPALRALSPTTRIVVFSGFDSPALVAEALARGAAAFLEKATPVRELPARLLAVLAAEPPPAAPTDAAAPEPDAEPGAPTSDDAVLAGQAEAFRMFFDQAAIGMATATLAGRLARVNASLAALLGSEERALVGHHVADLAPPAERSALRRSVAQVASGERDLADVEHGLARAEQRVLHTIVSVVRDRERRPLYLFVQIEDITDKRHAAEQLRESEERFRLLVEGVRDYAIFMLTPAGEIRTWNAGAERMKGYRAEEIIGQHFRVFYPTTLQEARHPEHELELAVRDGRYEEEGWRVRKDGSLFWASVVISALFDHDGQLAGFAKVTRDITERRLASAAGEEAAAALAATNTRLRLAVDETAQFLAVTAHELQSPVATITGAADLLLTHDESLAPSERRELLQLLARGATWLRRLLDDLLMASRLERGTFDVAAERVEVCAVVADVVAQLGADEVVLDCDRSCVARADATRVGQIITNLLTNAEKYGAPPVRLTVRHAGELVEILVRDAGTGVAPELEPRLFEKFAHGPNHAGRGSGLGLFIVRELARAQGGDAAYRRDEQGHPRFSVLLPAAD